MSSETSFNQIYEAARSIVQQDPDAKAIGGDAFGMSNDNVVVYSTKVPLGGKKRLEVGYTTEDARPDFEWLAEITIDDESYRHFLLLADRTIVETYGQNIMAVSPEDTRFLYGRLKHFVA